MDFSEVAKEVIRLATAIRTYWDTELPKRHPNYPVVSPTEDSGPPPTEERELEQLLEDLSPDEVYRLLLIMYLGRGDFPVHDLDRNYDYVKERFPRPELAISQLRGKAPLAEYLTDGIAELNEAGISVDELTFASANSSS